VNGSSNGNCDRVKQVQLFFFQVIIKLAITERGCWVAYFFSFLANATLCQTKKNNKEMTILLSSAVTNKVSVTSVSNVRRRYIGSARVIHSFTTEFCTKRQENTYLSGCVDIVQTAILDAANTSVMLGLQNNREKKGRRNSSSYATRQRNDRARMYVTHYEASEPKHRMRRYKSLLQVEMCIAFE